MKDFVEVDSGKLARYAFILYEDIVRRATSPMTGSIYVTHLMHRSYPAWQSKICDCVWDSPIQRKMSMVPGLKSLESKNIGANENFPFRFRLG